MKKKVFITHGYDDKLKNEVYTFLVNEGSQLVILYHEVNEGQTMVEKFKKYIDTVPCAVVLYTVCDEGKARNETELKKRTRQNAILEHG